jgi:hypothetical protein
MRREEVMDVLQKIPEDKLVKTMLVLNVGSSINIDCVMRKEPGYLVVRGREAGSNDEGRGFFVPYEQIAFIKLELPLKQNDFRAMYGEPLKAGSVLDEPDPTPAPGQLPAIPKVSASVAPTDIAKQNLLDRLRAARTSSGTGKPGK